MWAAVWRGFLNVGIALIFSFMIVWDMPKMGQGLGKLKESRLAAVWSEVLGKPVQYAGDNLDDWDRRVEGRFASHEQQDFRKTYKLMQKVGFGVPSGDLAEFENLLQFGANLRAVFVDARPGEDHQAFRGGDEDHPQRDQSVQRQTIDPMA